MRKFGFGGTLASILAFAGSLVVTGAGLAAL